MGMVRSENPAFIRLSDGRVLGRPKAGVAPPPPAPKPTPTASASSSASATPEPSGSTPASGR
jgi:hypothetical protein